MAAEDLLITEETFTEGQTLLPVRGMCFLSDDLALVFGPFVPRRENALDLWLRRGAQRAALDGLWMRTTSEDELAASILVFRIPRDLPAQLHAELVVATAAGELTVPVTELLNVERSVETMFQELVLDVAGRAALSTLLLTMASDGSRVSKRLATTLLTARDALRERRPLSELRADASIVAHVDALRRIDDSSFYAQGWLWNPDGEVTHLFMITPEGRRIDLARSIFRYSRRDVAEFLGLPPATRLGFVAFFTTPDPSILDVGWLLELELNDGTAVETDAPPVIDDLQIAPVSILADLELETLPSDELRRLHIRPALERLERRRARNVAIDAVDQHGAPPQEPAVSIIVPLHRRYDFLEWQLAEWVHDPEIRASDLIYVLDSPDDAAHVRALATHLHRLYRVPFRLAVLTSNAGFAGATNLGVSLARGRLLLLLNSDVLPEEPGWLSRMVEFYDSTPNIGAVGPKLLYEDGSIQHAGMYFARPEGSYVWFNEHYFKGLHRDLPPANVSRVVPALTAACMMIAADLYHELGGLRTLFIQGDYEDSDLCLRLREMGLDSWYLASVALFHLEGQSYPTIDRVRLSSYNRWLNTHLWDPFIADIMDNRDGATIAAAVSRT